MLCNFCPRKCNIDREKTAGHCRADSKIRIARADLHMWEEPIISASNGSGTIFFSGCALGCDFCQNSKLSHENFGKAIDENRLYDIMFELKSKGAHNINLVTADHYIPLILPTLKRAKRDGLCLPIVLNTSSYLTENAVKSLCGTVDIFLADLKFSSGKLSAKYCNAPDYPEIAKTAIDAMVNGVGSPIIENGIMQKGVIVRILVMPSCVIDAKSSIHYLYNKYGNKIFISVMGQYVPIESCPHPELKEKLPQSAYRSVVKYAESLGITNGFIQEGGADDIKYIPPFELQGV